MVRKVGFLVLQGLNRSCLRSGTEHPFQRPFTQIVGVVQKLSIKRGIGGLQGVSGFKHKVFTQEKTVIPKHPFLLTFFVRLCLSDFTGTGSTN